MRTDTEAKLYADALYWHLIGKGYPEWKAKTVVDKLLLEQKL